jgi:hypothetical protein
MSKKKEQISHINQELEILWAVVDSLHDAFLGCKDSGPCCGKCVKVGDTPHTYTTTNPLTPEIKVAALEEANASLWERLEDVEQEADEYARQCGELRAALAGREGLLDKYRAVLSRISNYQESNAAEAAWEALR